MSKNLSIIMAILFTATQLQAQTESTAGNWKTWFISSGKAYRLPPPPSYKGEVEQVLSLQQNLDSAGWQQILYWNAGAPGYRWYDMMSNLYLADTSNNGVLVMASMLLNVAIYDATIAAWDTKYAYKRPRPFVADSRIKAYVPKPESPSYPCEHSVAAGAATTLIAHFFPSLADSAHRLAQQLMASRIAAGVAFPSDTRAGFELGRRIARQEIEHTKDFAFKTAWDRKMPDSQGRWKGEKPMFPLAGRNKTIVLDSSSQFRPGPPPDFAKEMAELKNYKQTFRSMSNAFFWASQDFWGDVLHKKIFEYNLHLNPPRAAQLYAISAVGMYDGFVACWDAKYTYWGIRPNQYDTTFHPALLITPPFPGYPSGHAAVGGAMSELYSYFFPAERAYFRKKAKEGAESRFQAGIHFRSDNEAGLEMGRKIADAVIQKVKTDGADDAFMMVRKGSR
jgi:membrane-associated phospholipid phosphatase